MGALTLVTLFVKMLKFFLNINFKENNIVKENKESFEIFIYLFIFATNGEKKSNAERKCEYTSFSSLSYCINSYCPFRVYYYY